MFRHVNHVHNLCFHCEICSHPLIYDDNWGIFLVNFEVKMEWTKSYEMLETSWKFHELKNLLSTHCCIIMW